MTRRSRLYAVAAASACIGLAAGLNFDSLKTAARQARAYASEAFARPIELALWAQLKQRTPEPIIAPADMLNLVQACVGTADTIDLCTDRRSKLIATIRSLEREPEGVRDIALCLTDGCEGTMPVAPANACLWWTLYVDALPDKATSADSELALYTCRRANFGTEERSKRLINLWSEGIKDRSWLRQRQ
ncbi:MAG: hypothetical protein GY873_30270 [Bosea sp.]|uniref:hypothetical protein n=1 Tax=Bosea sp. (in: a-proteobacteria) TaxID=1871050 RepID=UPI0023A466EF|nr:hypothetical protein [Bosea sp. (in: a-proteobacteria)]MCP4738482.1 hypothetical protein [Bosea sp. (in: a-proteobacteria)]